jgi:tyrosinase
MARNAPQADMVGASEPSIALPGTKITTHVAFLQQAREAVLARLAGKRRANAYLNLEHVTGSGLHGTYKVYINIPAAAGAQPAPEPLYAGLLSTFGVRKASLKDNPHGGSGITTVLDITKLIHKLHDEHSWDGHHLEVTLVPEVPPGRTEPLPPSDLKIGRVSVYYS